MKRKQIRYRWSPSHEDHAKANDVGERIPDIDVEILDGTPDEIRERLALLEKYAPSPITFEVHHQWGHVDFDAFCTRPETDSERAKRLRQNKLARERRAKAEAKKVEAEKKLLAKLKEKYD